MATVDEVRHGKKGDHVKSERDTKSWRKLAADPWFSADGTICRISLVSFDAGRWIAADNWTRIAKPDKGKPK